jgi:hypothetical protein
MEDGTIAHKAQRLYFSHILSDLMSRMPHERVFIYDVLNDSVGSLGCTWLPNMSRTGRKGKPSWPKLKPYCPEGLKELTTGLKGDNCFPAQDLNLGPPK